MFLQRAMQRAANATALTTGSESQSETTAEADDNNSSSSTTGTAPTPHEDSRYAFFETQFAGTDMQYNAKLKVKVVYADNQTLQQLPDDKMYAEVLARCGNIAPGTKVRTQLKSCLNTVHLVTW